VPKTARGIPDNGIDRAGVDRVHERTVQWVPVGARVGCGLKGVSKERRELVQARNASCSKTASEMREQQQEQEGAADPRGIQKSDGGCPSSQRGKQAGLAEGSCHGEGEKKSAVRCGAGTGSTLLDECSATAPVVKVGGGGREERG